MVLTVANVNELQMNASIDLVFCFIFIFDFWKIKTSHRERVIIATNKKSIVSLFLKFKITNFKKMDIYHLKLLIFMSNKLIYIDKLDWINFLNSF